MSLPEQTTYDKLSSSITPASIQKIGKTISKALPVMPRKSVDVSKYDGLKNQINGGSYIPASSQAPSSGLGDGANAKFGTVSTPYGGSTRYEKFHPALDIANDIGTNIPTFTGGTVTEVISGRKQGDPGYGNYVIIKDEEGNSHRYSHLQNAYVQVGQRVGAGSVIGAMGNTGQTYSPSGTGTGSHLDYRVKDLYGKYMDPNKFIN